MKIIKENHKGQLTIGELEDLITRVKSVYGEEAKNIPVYIGDDDELNGIHCAWFSTAIIRKNHCKEEALYLREMINGTAGNHKLGDDEAAILIS